MLPCVVPLFGKSILTKLIFNFDRMANNYFILQYVLIVTICLYNHTSVSVCYILFSHTYINIKPHKHFRL